MKKPVYDLVLLSEADKWDILEKLFSLPVAERAGALSKLIQQRKAEYIGSTDKSASELATELIKKGVRARSYTKPKEEK